MCIRDRKLDIEARSVADGRHEVDVETDERAVLVEPLEWRVTGVCVCANNDRRARFSLGGGALYSSEPCLYFRRMRGWHHGETRQQHGDAPQQRRSCISHCPHLPFWLSVVGLLWTRRHSTLLSGKAVSYTHLRAHETV